MSTPPAARQAAPQLPEGWTVNPAPTDPAFVVTYGKSGAGKTTDMVYSFPTAVFLTQPGAIKMAMPQCGYQPTELRVGTIMEATALIPQVAKAGYGGVVVDDFSALAENTFAAIEAAIKGNNKFAKFDAMRTAVLQFRNTARAAGCFVVLNAWEQEPKINEKNERLRGGPMLSGKLPEQLPAMADLVLRIGYDGMRQGRHPYSYFVQGGLDWVGKDRDTGTPNPAPVNLAEILRFNGYTVPRLRGLEAGEAYVQDLALKLFVGNPNDDRAAVEATYAALLGAGLDRRHAYWLARDGYDRAQLQRAGRDRWTSFFPANALPGIPAGPPPAAAPPAAPAAPAAPSLPALPGPPTA